jgi:hypothetical protein
LHEREHEFGAGKLGRPYRKRELSPLRRACLSLGLNVDAKPRTRLASRLRAARLGKTAVDYLRFSDDQQARQIVRLYDRLNATERKAVTIDYLVLAAGADVHHVSGVIEEEVSRAEGIMAGILVWRAVPDVTKKLIEHALKPNGYKDRTLLYQLTGPLLPMS